MSIFALAGTKGGCGKSTIAINLAAELHGRGGRVLLIDADPQQTAVTWSAVALTAGDNAEAPTVAYIDSSTITRQVAQLAEAYDHVVIDTAGRMDVGQRGALLVSDVVIYPLSPSVVDVWAMEDSLTTLREIQEMQAQTGAYVVQGVAVLNRLQAGTVVAKQIRETAEGMSLPVAGALSQRVAYAEAAAAGKGVCTYAPSSPGASEVRLLVDELVRVAEQGEQQDVA